MSLLFSQLRVWIANKSFFKTSEKFYIKAYSKMLFFEEAVEQLQMNEFDLKNLTLQRIKRNDFYFNLVVISFLHYSGHDANICFIFSFYFIYKNMYAD